jgi:hypothetical protein
MQYVVGGKIISKKPHACGGNQWTVLRTGADVKIKCEKCGRAVFLSVDEVKKISLIDASNIRNLSQFDEVDDDL